MATSTLGSGTLVLAGTTSGTTTVTATAVAGTTTLTLPAATDTLVGKATTDTLTNKTLTSPTISGVATFAAGSAAAPAITTTGDTNTGIFFPAADTIAFSEGGTEAARIDSSGNLLVGTTTASSGHLIKVTNTASAGLIFTGTNSVANDGTLSATIANGSILMVSENTEGDGALFFCGYKSATITLLSDPNNRYATSVTAGRICVTKSANSGTVTITNKTGGTASITFSKVSNSD